MSLDRVSERLDSIIRDLDDAASFGEDWFVLVTAIEAAASSLSELKLDVDRLARQPA